MNDAFSISVSPTRPCIYENKAGQKKKGDVLAIIIKEATPKLQESMFERTSYFIIPRGATEENLMYPEWVDAKRVWLISWGAI